MEASLNARNVKRLDYECHVTVDLSTSRSPTSAYEACLEVAKHMKWHTSEIMGDPVLGSKPYFYFTNHGSDYQRLFREMAELSEVLDIRGLKVVRHKIELIIFDTKQKERARGPDDQSR